MKRNVHGCVNVRVTVYVHLKARDFVTWKGVLVKPIIISVGKSSVFFEIRCCMDSNSIAHLLLGKAWVSIAGQELKSQVPCARKLAFQVRDWL